MRGKGSLLLPSPPGRRAGDRGISADTAVRLGLALGIDPQFWLNLQAQYDIEVIQRDQGAQLAEQVSSLAA